MPHYSYDRLSGQDNNFLLWETPALPMQVGGTQIFDAGPLQNEDGGIRFDEIKQLTESVLHRIPRYRQKLQWVPGESQAVWVDDPQFNIDYHFRHTSLPRPGTEAQLKRLTARVMEHGLDRSRPLWETWVVEGLEGNRFALINKIHHCVLDGAGGVDISQILLSTAPEREIREAPNFMPRPHPTGRELRMNEWKRRLAAPLEAAGNLNRFIRDTKDLGSEMGRQLRSIGTMAGWKAVPASETPLNGEVGPHRAIEWRTIPLAQMKAVKNALDCTINDVVLAAVTGAVRLLMQRRQVRAADLDFRVSSPVNVRREADEGELGNHVSSWILRLPIGEAEPLEQLNIIRANTLELKRGNQASAVNMINSIIDWLPIDVQAASRGTMNMIVSNVPGPPFPLYMLGSEMLSITPLPPLIDNVGLVVGVLSYNGKVCWGFNADYDRIPDLDDFASSVVASFERLAAAAGVSLAEISGSTATRPQNEELSNWLHPAQTRDDSGDDGGEVRADVEAEVDPKVDAKVEAEEKSEVESKTTRSQPISRADSSPQLSASAARKGAANSSVSGTPIA